MIRSAIRPIDCDVHLAVPDTRALLPDLESGLPGTRFELWTGQSWCDSDNVQARAYAVEGQPGEKLATGPFEAETVPVSVEQNYVVITV